MRNMIIIVLMVVVGIQAQAKLRVDVQLDKSSYMVGEAAIGRIEIINESNKSVTIIHGVHDARGGIEHVLFEDGKEVRIMVMNDNAVSVPPRSVYLGPNEKISKPLLLMRDKSGQYFREPGVFVYVLRMTLVVDDGNGVRSQALETKGTEVVINTPGQGYAEYSEATKSFVSSYISFFYSFNAGNINNYFGDMSVYYDYSESLYKLALLNYCSVDLKNCMLQRDPVKGRHGVVKEKMSILYGDGALSLKSINSPFMDELWMDIINTLDIRIEKGGYQRYSGGDMIITNR